MSVVEVDPALRAMLAELLDRGSHEEVLRQCLAVLHEESSLYQKATGDDGEEERIEAQVLSIFRSFPYKPPAVPVADASAEAEATGNGAEEQDGARSTSVGHLGAASIDVAGAAAEAPEPGPTQGGPGGAGDGEAEAGAGVGQAKDEDQGAEKLQAFAAGAATIGRALNTTEEAETGVVSEGSGLPAAPAGSVAAGVGAAAAAAVAAAPAAAAAAVPPPAAPAASAAPATATPVEAHLKTAGQPLTYSEANAASSPTEMSEDLLKKLKDLKLRRKYRYLVMRVDGTVVVPDASGAPDEGPEHLRTSLPYSDCRYAIYDLEYLTHDGRKTNKLLFISWLPHNATPRNKMAYTHGKVAVRRRMEGLYDVAASTFEDVEEALGLRDGNDSESDIDM